MRKEDIADQIDSIIGNIRTRADFLREAPPQLVIGTFFVMFLSAVTCMKHWGFREENE